MSNRRIYLVTFIAIWFLSFIVGLHEFVYTHEELHKQIYSQYGIQSNDNVSFLGLNGGNDNPDNFTNVTGSLQEMNIFNSFNDVIGYYFQATYVGISIVILFLGIVLVNVWSDTKVIK